MKSYVAFEEGIRGFSDQNAAGHQLGVSGMDAAFLQAAVNNL